MKRIVGIDLGTTHCAVSYSSGDGIVDFAIPQLVGPGRLQALPLLPSSLYLAGAHEFSDGLLDLPWGKGSLRICGQMAREYGAKTPGRLVHSAKSWLCHSRVDRRAAILPWGAPEEVGKVSPVEASAAYLAQIAAAWDAAMPNEPITQQEIVLTLPASFDEVARKLTLEAAQKAGLLNVSLVEEPQAAFQAYAHHWGAQLAQELAGLRRVLVIDVGGGTTDLTLIEIGERAGELDLRRVAVSEHLMLGGDNMDAALVRLVEERMVPVGKKLTAGQWAALLHACRLAKENLLQEAAPESARVSIAGEGSRLIGATLSGELRREEVQACLVEGFFPVCGLDEPLQKNQRAGLQELGLPFAQDAAITRHIAAFLKAHVGQARGAEVRPDAVLLNGGVFKSPLLVTRLLEVLNAWFPGVSPLRMLANPSHDLAVARGAVAHGLAQRGRGPRIGGGSAHAFYLGVDDGGGRATRKVVCVVAHGQESGSMVDLEAQGFEIVTGRPVRFPLYASSVDRGDRLGAICAWDESYHVLPHLQTVLPSQNAKQGRERVHLRSCLTALGTLELSCVSEGNGQDLAGKGQVWNLEFDLRSGGPTAGDAVSAEEPAVESGSLPSAVTALLESVLGGHAAALPTKQIRTTLRQLEALLGARETWDLALLRALWTWIYRNSNARRRGPEQERLYYQLFGYTLRPGFGDVLDAWRVEQAIALLAEGVKHVADLSVWNEYWIVWRRLAPGMVEAEQQRLWLRLEGHLARRVPPHPPKHLARPKGVAFEGVEEMVRVAASLELLDPVVKVTFGRWLLERIADSDKATGPWVWALGRLGARVPLHAGAHKVVRPEIVQPWVEMLIQRGADEVTAASFAIVQMACCSGDLSRDLPEDFRRHVIETLQANGVAGHLVERVSRHIELEPLDLAKVLGDSLPVGLKLSAAPQVR